jgi:hypothetical protein
MSSRPTTSRKDRLTWRFAWRLAAAGLGCCRTVYGFQTSMILMRNMSRETRNARGNLGVLSIASENIELRALPECS